MIMENHERCTTTEHSEENSETQIERIKVSN